MREPRTLNATLPTELERRGDFSQSRNATGGLRQIYDPLTTVFDAQANRATRQAFPNNTIPDARIDRTARRFLQDIWKPNNPGDNITGVNNFRETFPQKFVYWNISDRADWNVNDKWRVFGRVSRFHTIQSDPLFTGSPAQPLAGSARHTIQVSGDAVWTISPSTVFNIRGSYSKITDSFEAANGRIEKKLLEELWPGNAWYEPYLAELPALYYPGLNVQAESASVFGRDGFWFQEPKTWNLQSKISRQMGPHYVKIGGEFRQQLVLAARPRPMGFRFDKNHTADTFIQPDLRLRGDGWATFLLGAISDNSRIQNVALNKPRNQFWSFYIQDDFKLSQKITVNLGLRYEYQTAITDPENRLSRFLDLNDPIPEFKANPPQLPAQVTALRPSPPIYNGAWIFTDGDHRGAWDPQSTLFLPRAGIAIRLNDRTALRIGYARYAVASDSATSIVDVLGSTPYTGFDQTTNPLPVLEGRPQAFLADPYAAGRNPLIRPVGKTLGRYTPLGGDAIWFEQNWRNETNDRLNVSFQRQTFNHIVMDVTYFANFGHHAPQNLNLNLMDPRLSFQHKALLNQRVNNPFYRILTPQQFPGQLRNQQQVTVGTLMTPYPQFGTLTFKGAPLSSTRYHALQISAQRPFMNGFNLLFGFNYNRGRSEEFYDNVDEFDRKLTYQSTNFTLPRRKITGAAIYQFPFGRGRKFMSKANPVLDGVLGGWAVSGIFEYYSGVFLRFGGLDVTGDPRLDNPSNQARFNTSVFKLLPAFTRRSNPWMYEGVTGPSFRNLDLTLSKEFPITEKVSFELRMESYNFTNNFKGANPSTDVNSSVFGRVVNQRAGYFGRQFQYSGRFRW